MLQFIPHYDYIFKELADPRVSGWTFMEDAGPTLLIAVAYLLSVCVFLPAYMKNRQAYQLKTVILCYNVSQILICIYLTYGIMTSGWTTRYSLGCQPVNYTNDPMEVRMLNFVYYTHLLKMAELLETVFFVLRNKQQQVSKLHLYHHVSTLLLTWLGAKYIGGGMATFPIMVNCFIHVLMYFYYLLASFGPEWQKKLAKWKPKLTILQMIQFAVIVAHAMQSLHPNCIVPKKLLLIYVPNVAAISYMFWDFYNTNYIQKSKKKSK